MCLVSAVDEDTASRWASQIAGAEKGQAELSDTRRSGRSETAVTQSCFNLLMN
jgi:predicted secreted protein